MRDPKRIGPMLHRLATLWRTYPDLRLGQLIANLAQHGVGKDVFNIEDEEMAMRIEEAIKDWAFLKENGDE